MDSLIQERRAILRDLENLKMIKNTSDVQQARTALDRIEEQMKKKLEDLDGKIQRLLTKRNW